MMTQAGLKMFRRQAQRQLEALYPAEVTFPGRLSAVACAGGSVQVVGAQLERGGWVLDYEVAFRVRKELLENVAPKAGRDLSWKGRKFVIGRVSDDESDVAYTVAANSGDK